MAMAQLLVDPGGAIGALGLVVDDPDLLEQLGVGDVSLARSAVAALVIGGTGDLEQTTRPIDAVACDFSASMKGSTFTGSPWRKKLSLV